jgi:hypothetical protein
VNEVREFRLPDLGEGLTEAEIVRWLVEVRGPIGRAPPRGAGGSPHAPVGVARRVGGLNGHDAPVAGGCVCFKIYLFF